jgi:hypothetical protein
MVAEYSETQKKCVRSLEVLESALMRVWYMIVSSAIDCDDTIGQRLLPAAPLRRSDHAANVTV